MNFFDRLIQPIAPKWALRRAKARAELSRVQAAYETAERTRTRKIKKSEGGPDKSVEQAGKTIREQARHFDENHDLVNGVLTCLVNNVIGPNGISVEPQPKTRDGEIHADFAARIDRLYREWSQRPEVTWEHDRAAMERMEAHVWFRDGEYFLQQLPGNVATLEHGTRVPFSVELLEADMVPMDLFDDVNGIFQGIEKNNWGRPRAYHVYFNHPGSPFRFDRRLKRVPADRMLHPKHVKRFRQTRGVSVLASVMARLHDLKDYEESERVAARIAAAMGFYIKKGTPDLYESSDQNDDDEREFPIEPGMVWDNLRVGEDVGTFEANRPSQMLPDFRNAMLKAVSSGTGTNFSTVSREYNGSFSAQRQELVERFVDYSALTATFVGQSARPNYERFLQAATAAGVLRRPRDLDPQSLFDAEFRGPVMPWVDPVKEAKAAESMVQAGFKSRSQVIRERGGNPRDVDAEIRREREGSPDFTTTPKPDGSF